MDDGTGMTDGERNLKIVVVGLGYVGLPLAMSLAAAGLAVTGFDIDPAKIAAIRAGRSYIEAVHGPALAAAVSSLSVAQAVVRASASAEAAAKAARVWVRMAWESLVWCV